MQDKNTFVFYEYLIFFWKKKFWLLPLPILLIVVTLIYTLSQQPTYIGSSTVYTGSVEKDTLMHPDIVETNLKKELKDETKINLSVTAVTDRMTINLSSKDKNIVMENLNKLTKMYQNQLLEVYNDELKIRKEEVSALEKNIAVKEESLALLRKNLNASINDEFTRTALGEMLQKEEENLLDTVEKLKDKQLDLINLTEPQILSKNVYKKNNFIISNLIVSFLAGIFLSFLFLTFWKYIQDARRYKENG